MIFFFKFSEAVNIIIWIKNYNFSVFKTQEMKVLKKLPAIKMKKEKTKHFVEET